MLAIYPKVEARKNAAIVYSFCWRLCSRTADFSAISNRIAPDPTENE